MREKIKLESSPGTGHFYTTTKNKRTTPDKIEIRKYDPKARKHVMTKEGKLRGGGRPPPPGRPRAGAGFFSPAEAALLRRRIALRRMLG